MKRFFIKTLLFLLFITTAQIVLARYVLPPVPEVALLQKYLDEKYQILYFGDSVITAGYGGDKDKRTVVEMLSHLDPSHSIGVVSHGGSTLDLYLAYLTYISRSDWKPEAIVVPINLQSLSVGWALKPANQFERLKFYFTKPALLTDFYHPLAVMNAINLSEVPAKEFADAPVRYGTTTLGRAAEFEAEKIMLNNTEPEHALEIPNYRKIMRDMYIYAYMTPVAKTHPKLAMLQKIIDMAKTSHIALYFYITPLDHEGGEAYLGEDLPKQVAQNAEVVCSVVKENGLPCLDLSLSLGSEYFSHPLVDVNEHLKETGRQFLAKEIYDFTRSNLVPKYGSNIEQKTL